MKPLLDLTQVITNLKGEPLKGSPLENSPGMSIADAIIEALLAQYIEEKNITGKDKLTRFLLAERISKAPEAVELSHEELTLIVSLVPKGYGPNVVGRVFQALGTV